MSPAIESHKILPLTIGCSACPAWCRGEAHLIRTLEKNGGGTMASVPRAYCAGCCPECQEKEEGD